MFEWATLEMVTAAEVGTILMLNGRVAVSRVGVVESRTWTVKLYVPAVVGVPVITPPLDMARPGGKEPVNEKV